MSDPDRPDPSPRGDARWVLPLVSFAIAAGFLAAITWLRLFQPAPTGPLAPFVKGVDELFGFEPSFMVAALAFVWSSIWFLTGRVDRPLGRLFRILALGFCLAVLVGLRGDGASIESGGRIGSYLAQRLGDALSPGLATFLVGAAVIASLLLATDFFFFGFFKRLADRAASGGPVPSRPAPRVDASGATEAVAERRAPNGEGVERAAIAELESLRLAHGVRAPEPAVVSERDVESELRRPREDDAPFGEADALSRVAAVPEAGERRERRRARREWAETPPPPPSPPPPALPPEPIEDVVAFASVEISEDPVTALEADALDRLDAESPRAAPEPEPEPEPALELEIEPELEPEPVPESVLVFEDESDPLDERVIEFDVTEEEAPPDEYEFADPPEERIVELKPYPRREPEREPVAELASESASEPIVEVPQPEVLPEQQRLFGATQLDEALIAEARELVVRYRRASVTFLRRRLRVGAEDAIELMRELERRGVVECGEDATQGRVVLEG